MMQWTEEQKRVIDERGSNILVSAAAGSGKTAVLCERIIERLCDPDEPVSLDRLLIMTFTRAAAEEMKDRIASALSERIAVTEDEALLSHLRKQRLLLRDADISTIDSLCRRLLREYYQDLDIDPGARTAEEGELRLLRADVLSELLEDRYTEGDQAFLDFAESFSSRRNDEKLSEMIEDTYMFIQGDPWPRLFLRRMLKEAEDEMEGEFYGLPWYGYLMEHIRRDAMEQKELLSSCIPICEEEDGPGPYIDGVQELSAFFDSVLEAGDYEELYRLIPGYKPSRLKAVRSKDVDALKKNAVKQCIDISRERIKFLSALFMLPPDIMKRAVSGAASYIKELVLLSSEFMDRFDAAKREKNIVDFNDMEHLCLQILYDETEEGMKPSAIADELCMRYDEILVDEYQDSNMVQEALIYALSAERFGRPDVFMVGDVKQSIYRFRLAKPELFMDKYHSYRTGEGSGPEGVRIDLNRNFRSRDQVIGSVNDVFMRIMGRELGGIDYDESAALHKGAEFEGEGQDYVTELEILDISKEENDEAEADRSLDPYAELSADEQEALLIGWKIKEMTGGLGDEKRLLISDRQHGGLRPVSYGDIAILLRAPGKRADTYVDMLSALGIPAYTESSHGYFDAYEVRIMLSFLNIIDDPRQDIDLAAVMRSMIGGFSDEELARIRILFEGRGDQPSGTGLTDLYEALMYCSSLGSEGDISGKCRSFLSLLNELRDLSDMIPVGRLIGRIYARTGFYDYAGLLPMGRARRKNLDMLLENAEDYGDTGERSLFGFVRYIEMLKKYDTDHGEAPAAAEGGDTVRIVSIHRSKGLEYPVVILADTGKLFNREDRKNDILMDSELGLGTDHIDTEKRIRYPGLKRAAIRQKVTEESLAEELRILYVAMTRAREKLVITAAIRDPEKKLEKFYAFSGSGEAREKLPASLLLSAGSFLDLILMSGAAERGSLRLHIRKPYELSDMKLKEELDKDGEASALLTELQGLSFTEEELSSIRESIDGDYAFSDERGIRPKISVSELKAMEADYDDGALEDELSAALSAEEGDLSLGRLPAGGSAHGNAFHRFMELLEFKRLTELPEDEKGRPIEEVILGFISEERDRILALELMTREELSSVSDSEILSFLSGELAMDMARAHREGRLWREQRFMASFPADQLSPSAKSSVPQLLQGIVDAYFEDEEGEINIVDYKTDRLYTEEAFKERYGLQLRLYRMSLEKLTAKKVRRSIIYSTVLGRCIY